MTVFIQNALGFWLQLFPCVLIIFLPFSAEAYRVKKRSFLIGMTAFTVGCSALYSAVLCLRDTEKVPYHNMISNVSMLIALLLILGAYVLLVRESMMKKLLVFSVAGFYGVAVFMLINLIDPFFSDAEYIGIYAYDWLTDAECAVISAVLFTVLVVAVIRPLSEYIREIEPQSMKREFAIATVSTLFYFIMEFYCSTLFSTFSGFDGVWGISQYQLLIMILIMAYQIAIYWLIFRESVRRKHDSDRRRALEIRQLQYEMIVGDMENIRRMRHDLRHHYATLGDMLERGRLDEMREYISGQLDATVKHDSEVYCQNVAINGLLQCYIGMARDEDIRCDVKADCAEAAIEPADLTVIFGNAMENAIISCRKCPENRWIEIQIGTFGGSLAIEISNSCREVKLAPSYRGAEGFLPAEAYLSTRRDGGYGLGSIAHTARKYDGTAQFKFDGGEQAFTARIRLNGGKG